MARVDHTRWAAEAPVWMAADDALDIALSGEQPETQAVVDAAAAAAAVIVEQVSSLVELARWEVQTYILNEDQHTVDVMVDWENGQAFVRQRADVNRCTTVQCLESFPSSLPNALGCLPGSCGGPYTLGTVLSASVDQPYVNTTPPYPIGDTVGGLSTAAGSEGRLKTYPGEGFREWGRDTLLANGSLMYGWGGFIFYVQNRRVHPAYDVFATSQQTSMNPEGRCKVDFAKGEVNPAGKNGGMDMSGMDPEGPTLVDHQGTETITAGIETGTKSWNAGLTVTSTWQKWGGLAGSENTKQSGQRTFWKANGLSGPTGETRGANGLATWFRPRYSGSTWTWLIEGTALCTRWWG